MIAAPDVSRRPYIRGVLARPVVRRAVRRAVIRRRGIGQACAEYDDSGNCIDAGTTVNLFPGGSLPQNPVTPVVASSSSNPFGSFLNPTTPSSNPAISTLLSPSSTVDVGGSPYGAVGSNGGCASGYVVGDASGNCVPATTLLNTISTTAGAASAGLSPTQAAAITTALKAATVAVGGAAPAATIVPASTNPFAAITPTQWMLIAGGAAALLLLSSSRKRR